MKGTCLIEIRPKEKRFDPEAHHLEPTLKRIAGLRVNEVGTAQLYRLVGELDKTDQQRATNELLCDPVIQIAKDGTYRSSDFPKNKTPQAVFDVWYKSGVTDVVGSSVLKAVQDLGLRGIEDVRYGQRIYVWGKATEKIFKEQVAPQFGNTLIQDIHYYAG